MLFLETSQIYNSSNETCHAVDCFSLGENNGSIDIR